MSEVILWRCPYSPRCFWLGTGHVVIGDCGGQRCRTAQFRSGAAAALWPGDREPERFADLGEDVFYGIHCDRLVRGVGCGERQGARGARVVIPGSSRAVHRRVADGEVLGRGHTGR